MNIITEFGSMRKIRLGRCVRAPAIKNLLSVGMLARKGHECIMSEHNPRIVMKDGTVVPMYFVNNLFLLPYLLPIDVHVHGVSVEEADAMASAFSMDESSMPEEAVVHLATTALPSNIISKLTPILVIGRSLPMRRPRHLLHIVPLGMLVLTRCMPPR